MFCGHASTVLAFTGKVKNKNMSCVRELSSHFKNIFYKPKICTYVGYFFAFSREHNNRQDLNPTQSEASWETDELPRSYPPSKRIAKETTLRQRDTNRGPLAGSFTLRSS
ncbi:hypothetical protein AVEN_86490-1 [Araneus ventricosus]|uniref:Uncharacterized protein n=1 Tax=Araneus ventricosus TaxID=182803 RepID=A0A4Y2URN9_ARAVE|nr:hypothetical protein AVEN_86490-1 [Araneus ventricosus]